MASALFKLSSDGGSTYLTAGTALADDEALAYNAAGSYSIKAALDSTAGVDTVQWSITSADDVNIASLPAVTQNADKTCEFSVTKAGGAWLLRCIVNGGVNALTGKTDPALVRALAVKVLNSAGQQEVAVGESSEAGPYGWTKAHNDVARAGGGGGITESQLRTAAAALTASLDVNGQKIVDLGTPTASTDAATKGYVDGLITTLDLKASVRVATTGGLISLSGEQTIDGVSAVAGDRVLVKNQEVASLNGIYVVAAGAWSRATDADSSAEVTCGMFCFVEEGTTNGGTGWLLTTANPITLGVTGLLFQKFTNTALDEPGFRALAATLAADLDVNTQKITSVADPTDPQDAATKASSEAAATAAAQNEANLRTAAAALTDTIFFNAAELADIGNPTTDLAATNRSYVLRQITDLIYDHGGTAGNRVYTSLAAAVTAAASIDGLVRIWIKVTSGIPTTASGTYALGNRIELCGLSGGSPGTKVTLQIAAGTVFQNPCAFRNMELEHDLAAAWITSTGSISVVFDNTNIVDNGATADICTLGAATSNYIAFDNGSTYTNGGSGALCTLSSGKSLDLYVRDAIVSDNAVLGSAGTLRIYQGGSGSVPSQSGFSGTLSADVQDVVRQLGEARTAVDVNSQKITSLAVPTSDQDGVPRMHVNGYNDVNVAGSGSVSLSTADTDWYLVDLIGTLSGDRTVSLPNAQRSLLVRNGTAGTYTLRLTGSAGGFTYLAPGQVRRVYTNGTTLIGEALRVVEFETTVDLSSGYTVGDHDVTLFKVPAAFDVDRVEIRCTTSVATGSAAVSVGVSGSYNQLVLSTAIATAGDVVGLDTAEAGADFTDKIAAHYSTAQTLTLRVAVATGTLTAGALRVMVVGRHVGE